MGAHSEFTCRTGSNYPKTYISRIEIPLLEIWKMNKVFILVLALALISVNGRPRPQFGNLGALNPANWTKQGGKNHGTTKLLTGAGVWALGKVTGNQQLQATGKGLKTLGAATLIGSHFLPQGRR